LLEESEQGIYKGGTGKIDSSSGNFLSAISFSLRPLLGAKRTLFNPVPPRNRSDGAEQGYRLRHRWAGGTEVDAFNFNPYGLIEGRVVSISSDAIVRDKPQDKNNANQHNSSQEETSEPANQELAYAARVSLARTQMEIEDKVVELSGLDWHFNP
jgi:hypothetical protein